FQQLIATMLSAGTAILSSLTGLLLLQYLYDNWRRRRGPPGPWGVPLLGCLLQLRPTLWDAGRRFRRLYGDIVQLPTLPGREVLLVQGFEAIREMLVASGDQFNGRLRNSLRLRLLNPGHRGIAASMGPSSDTLRRFSLRTLKNFGLGRAESERRILQEFEQLRAQFLANCGRDFDPRNSINKAVALVTLRFLFGDLAAYDSQEFSQYLEASSTVLRYQQENSIINEIALRVPFLFRIVPERWLNIKRVYNAVQKLLEFNQTQVTEHKRRIAEEGAPQEPGNYTEAFLIEQMKPDSPAELFNDDQLAYCLADLFIAGSDTTTNTLLWSLLLMAVHPEVQDRVHSELAGVVGSGRLPNMRDRPLLPYTDAVIHEVMRYRPIAAMLLPHTPLDRAGTRLRNYWIPGNTLIAFSVISVHQDPGHWATPLEFNPGHFLDETGTKFRPSEYFMPFGLGRRACMGEALARMETFLFFACLMLSFQVSLDPGCQPGPLDKILQGNMAGGVLGPLPFRIRALPR
ncbi:hypothetical protein BOX15_Mlig019189g1, partial [Macrostomum lignano]